MRCKDLRTLFKRYNAMRLVPMEISKFGTTYKKKVTNISQLVHYWSCTNICDSCGGSGCWGPYDDPECCEKCEGHGRVFPNIEAKEKYATGPQMRGVYKYVPVEDNMCPMCLGSGTSSFSFEEIPFRCSLCDGAGIINRTGEIHESLSGIQSDV